MASFKRPAAGVDAEHFGAEQTHPEDVQRLPAHVLGAHVDVALEAEQRAGRRRRDAVLPGAGFGDDAPLAHPHRQQRLTERVVDLVRAGMGQILALQEDARAAARRGQPPRFGDRRRPSDVVLQQPRELGAERRIVARREVGALELLDRLDERFGHEPPAELAEIAAGVRIAMSGGHSSASKSARMRAGSFTPGERSTPDDTSMPKGCTRATASATLSGVSPPASRVRRSPRSPRRPSSRSCGRSRRG